MKFPTYHFSFLPVSSSFEQIPPETGWESPLACKPSISLQMFEYKKPDPPDLQVVFKPRANMKLKNAVVTGFRLELGF